MREISLCFNPAAGEAAAEAVVMLDAGGEGEEKEGDGGGSKDGGDRCGLNGLATEEEKTLALIKPGVSELHSGERRDKKAKRGTYIYTCEPKRGGGSRCSDLRMNVTLKRLANSDE